MFNCIIFDVDGTLIDSKGADIAALKRILSEETGKDYCDDELGIVTSRNRKELELDPVLFGIINYLQIVVCADDTINHKPHPEPIQKFIEISNAAPEKTIYIGDTCYDMNCAQAAGVSFALALWGAKNPQDINAAIKLMYPNEILNIIGLY